jgi:peroxiredoxin
MTASVKTLAGQFADMKARMAASGPTAIGSVFAAERAALAAAGVPAGAPRPGQVIPDADLLDVGGQPVTLHGLLGGRPSVVVFYRGGWCPWCNLALRAYQQQLVPFLESRGVMLIALSPQKPDCSLSMAQQNQLTFVLATDPASGLARRLGILSPAPSQQARAAARASGVDVAGANIDGTDNLPMPATLVADCDGVIRWADVHPDYSMRSEPADIITAVTSTLPDPAVPSPVRPDPGPDEETK